MRIKDATKPFAFHLTQEIIEAEARAARKAWAQIGKPKALVEAMKHHDTAA
jgi:hypothetical protein